MDTTDLLIGIIEFHYHLKVRVGDPAHILEIKIHKGEEFYLASILTHTDPSGNDCTHIPFPVLINKNPVNAMNALLQAYFDKYNADNAPNRPTLTIVK